MARTIMPARVTRATAGPASEFGEVARPVTPKPFVVTVANGIYGASGLVLAIRAFSGLQRGSNALDLDRN